MNTTLLDKMLEVADVEITGDYNWVAQDKDGEIYVYARKPTLFEEVTWHDGGNSIYLSKTDLDSNWDVPIQIPKIYRKAIRKKLEGWIVNTGQHPSVQVNNVIFRNFGGISSSTRVHYWDLKGIPMDVLVYEPVYPITPIAPITPIEKNTPEEVISDIEYEQIIEKQTILIQSLKHEIEVLNNRNHKLQHQRFHNYNMSESDWIWMWKDDEPNFPRSMSNNFPIVISKEDLFRIAENGFNGIEDSNDE